MAPTVPSYTGEAHHVLDIENRLPRACGPGRHTRTAVQRRCPIPSSHRQAAALRPAGDALGFRCLTVAGQLSFASNDLSSAQSDMVAAAEQAIARGDVEKAAHAYADAAWVAKERKNPGQVWTLGSQAEILASSPLLSTTQRASILQRFTHTDRDLAAQATR
jgi:hypothetical protein